MRGIEINYNRGYGFILKDLLNGISYEKYDWYIEQSEIIYNNDTKDINAKCFSGKDFVKIISEGPYYIFFANIQVYRKHAEKKEIIDYNDFWQSNCDFIILISDGSFIEIYAKDNSQLSQIIQNANVIGFKDIIIKNEENDGRTDMFV